jgi:hypothetical protein
MPIAAVYCVYNEEEYITYSIRSIYDVVDRVFVLLGQAPYQAYNPQARRQFHQADRTEALVAELVRTHPEMAAHPEAGQFIIKGHLFWRSFRYRFPADELGWMPRRMFRLGRISRLGKSMIPLPVPARFTGNNKTNSWGTVYHIPPERVVFYHFSYARSPERMREKLLTFSHAHEILNGWFEQVWMRWPNQRDMTDIHPVDPPKFKRVVYQDPSDLPDILRSHPYYQQEIIA